MDKSSPWPMAIIICDFYIRTLQRLKVVRSTIAAQALSLLDGCHVAIYVNNMLSEPLHTKPNCLSITAYTDNQSLYDAVHSMKQTLEKHLVVDISAIQEMVERNEIRVTWLNKEKQMSDVLTKSGAPSNSMLQTLNASKMIEL